MKILVVAAHPDDEIYGMGGTIAKKVSQGHEVYVLIVTEGCTSQYRDRADVEQIILKKQEEAKRANALLGVKKVYFGGLADMRLDVTEHVQINAVIEKTVDEIQPDVVYTHFWGDVNLDHQCVYRSTLVAVRPTPGQTVKKVYCYRVPSSTEWTPQMPQNVFMPNVYEDISMFVEKKYAAIEAYQTECRAFPHPRSVEYVEKTDCAAGLEVGISSAETFMLLRDVRG